MVRHSDGESTPGLTGYASASSAGLFWGIDGAVEGAHMGHPDFRVNDRIFATLHHVRAFGGLAPTPSQQERFLREHPDAFEPARGA